MFVCLFVFCFFFFVFFFFFLFWLFVCSLWGSIKIISKTIIKYKRTERENAHKCEARIRQGEAETDRQTEKQRQTQREKEKGERQKDIKMLLHLSGGSAQTIVCADTLSQKLHIKLANSLSRRILTPSQPVLALTP